MSGDYDSGGGGGGGSGGSGGVVVAEVMSVRDESTATSLFGASTLSFVCAAQHSILLPTIKARLLFGFLDCGILLEPLLASNVRSMAKERITLRVGGGSSGSGGSNSSGAGASLRRFRLAHLHSRPITCVAVGTDASIIGRCRTQH
jgi:hypothetical protein